MSDRGFTSPPIWQFAKRGGVILAGERSFKGETFFELRWWAEGGNTPTGKGVTFPPDAVPELAAALAAYAESRKTGTVL
jgi:hypothetical protein